MRRLMIYSLTAATLLLASACGSKGTEQQSGSETDTAAFAQNQPMESGIYDAVSYTITGENAREGKFDGRVIAALSPDQSALYVYENGNRVKINYSIVLDRPFEKGDSNIYRAVDNKGKPVIVNTDSTVNTLTFDKNEQQVKIEFDKAARTTGSAMEMLERMNEQLKK